MILLPRERRKCVLLRRSAMQVEKWKRKPTPEEIEFARKNTARELDRKLSSEAKVCSMHQRDISFVFPLCL